MSGMSEHLFLRACLRQPVERTPIWMMRQAGRYLPAYRAVRARASFLDLCRTPELACEVTLQPIDEFGFDAAILFSDILITLPGMGLDVAFPDAGPKIATPVRTRAAIDALVVPDPTTALAPSLEAIRQIKRGLNGRVPLIGFAGAPLTMLTYAVEGGGSKDYAHTKKLLYGDPAAAHALLDKLARTCAAFLEAQVEAGCDAVQIFDSWGGIVSPGDFREYPLRYAKRVIETLRASPTFKGNLIGRYSFTVGEFDADVQGSYVYQNEVETDILPFNRQFTGTQGAYGIADFSASVRKGAYTLTLFINNAFDERADLLTYQECTVLVCGAAGRFSNPSGYPLGPPAFPNYTSSTAYTNYTGTNQPRTFGLVFRQEF